MHLCNKLEYSTCKPHIYQSLQVSATVRILSAFVHVLRMYGNQIDIIYGFQNLILHYILKAG